MPSQCSVPECTNRGGHTFPKDKKLSRNWVKAIRRKKLDDSRILWKPTPTSLVCRLHFKESDYLSTTASGTPAQKLKLRVGVVPSIFKWTKQVKGRRRLQRTNSSDKEDSTDIVEGDALIIGVNEVVETLEVEPTRITTEDKATQTSNEDVSKSDGSTMTAKFPPLCIERFRGDNTAIHFYTGLESYEKFVFVFQTLGEAAYCLCYMYGNIGEISVLNQFFLILIKLRLHKQHYELALLFGVSEADIYNICCTWVRFMALQWKELSLWSSRDVTRFYAPSGFKDNFPSTRVILDGTEFPIKKPTLPTAQQASYSTYKNRNTMKVVVGITPGGQVSYVSDAYAGSTSDRHIVERSRLPQNCDSGDSVMADKGFDVQDLFAPFDVAVNIPTFFKKCNQMLAQKVLQDRKISSKRVHVERLIGLAKTYDILTQPMNTWETQLSSDISYICFMLCNFRTGIVPRDA